MSFSVFLTVTDVSLHFILCHTGKLARQFLQLIKHRLLVFLILQLLKLIIFGVIVSHLVSPVVRFVTTSERYAVVHPRTSQRNINSCLAISNVFHAVDFHNILDSSLGFLLHFEIRINDTIRHFNISEVIKEIFNLIVMTAQINLFRITCLASQSGIGNLIQYNYSACNSGSCLLEKYIRQIYLSTHGNVLLLIIPLVKLLVC